MNILHSNYNLNCNTKSDINEHLPKLYEYATKCESIIELGVRGCISSWAFAYGLLNNNSLKTKFKKTVIKKKICVCIHTNFRI
jgi:hypothetical protein